MTEDAHFDKLPSLLRDFADYVQSSPDRVARWRVMSPLSVEYRLALSDACRGIAKLVEAIQKDDSGDSYDTFEKLMASMGES